MIADCKKAYIKATNTFAIDTWSNCIDDIKFPYKWRAILVIREFFNKLSIDLVKVLKWTVIWRHWVFKKRFLLFWGWYYQQLKIKIVKEKLTYTKIQSLLMIKTRILHIKTIQDIPNANDMVKMRDFKTLNWKRYIFRPLKQ